MKMKAMTVYAPGDIRLEEVEMRPLKADEILIKVIWAGVCATDLAIFSGECSFVKTGEIKYPCRIGHEWAGVVAQIGPKVKNFKPGDRVITDNGVTCGECEHCRADRHEDCVDHKSVGTINCWDGCFAEYMYMPERHTYHLDDRISMEDAALIEPLSIALSSIKQCTINEKSTVAVIGTGAIGLGAAALAAKFGAKRVIVIGRKMKKLETALKCGATDIVLTTQGNTEEKVKEIVGKAGVDITIETAGAAQMLNLALDITKQYGTVVSPAFYEKPIDQFNIDTLVSKRLQLKGAMGEMGYVPEAGKILASGLKVHDMITHRVAFEQAPELFRNAASMNGERIKALVNIGEDEQNRG